MITNFGQGNIDDFLYIGLVYIGQGLISKRLKSFELKTIENIFIELTISQKKWCIIFAYRPPNFEKSLSLKKFQKVYVLL